MRKDPVSSKGVIRNPLTVIAVFAGLAEVSATIALPQLNENIQTIFVWFVMLFPTLLVGLFFFMLWMKHHVLYAPSDFSDEANFMRHWQPSSTLPLSDVDEIEGTVDETEVSETEPMATEGAQKVRNEQMRVQRERHYSRIAEARLAEDLVINRLSSQLGLKFLRGMEFAGHRDIRFDGIAQSPSGPVLVEVKLLRSRMPSQMMMKREIERAAALTYRLSESELRGARLILGLVFDDEMDSQAIEGHKERLKKLRDEANLPISVELEFFSLAELKHGAKS